MQTDILVIGGGPAGIASAITAQQFYPDKKVMLMKSIEHGCVPCGIPYMVASLQDPRDNQVTNALLTKNKITVVIDKATAINRSHKEVSTVTGAVYGYEKLILATGSSPIIPPIVGITKKGVYPIYKDMEYLLDCVTQIKKSQAVLIIGGGFIGVEFADEIAKLAKVYLVEVLPNILNTFDPEFANLALAKLQPQVTVMTGVKVVAILGEEHVTGALLSNGQQIAVDSVILGTGAVPATQLAVAADLALDPCQGIQTDAYMRTSDPDILAVGDCAGKRDFFTQQSTSVMLAATAATEARIAARNLYQVLGPKNPGTLSMYATYLDGLVLSAAGLTEAQAQGLTVLIGEASGVDKHPSKLPGAQALKVKLIFSKHGLLLGGQIAGGAPSSELVNMLGMALQKGMDAMELATLQIATHPYVTSSPTMYPLILAAQAVVRRM